MKRNIGIRKFFSLLEVDFYRLLRSVAFYVIFGVFAAYQILDILITLAANNLMKNLLDFGLELELTTYSNQLFGSTLSYGNLGLFLVIFFAVFLCSEFRSNTIRNKLTLGYSRTMVYFASLTVTYIVTLMAVALSCVINAAIGIPVLGWKHSSYAMQYAFYSLFALLPLVALIHTLCYGSKSLGIALGVGLPTIIVLPSIFSLISLFANDSKGVEWVIRLIFIALEEYIPVALQYNGEVQILSNLALNASLSYILWTALFIVLGYFAFSKKDIK